MMINKLYNKRFEIFLAAQLFLLFGSLLFPNQFFENVLHPLIYLCSMAAGILLISKQKKMIWLIVGLFLTGLIIFGFDIALKIPISKNALYRFLVYFIFYIVVAWNIVKQVWKAKTVNKNVIMGLISGYISLGFLAFFLFMTIELIYPGAFSGLNSDRAFFESKSDSMLYFAYITLLTIGYGEIVPVIPIAQKAVILVGLTGQFYMVIITAVIIEKYIRHSTSKKE